MTERIEKGGGFVKKENRAKTFFPPFLPYKSAQTHGFVMKTAGIMIRHLQSRE